MSWQGFSNCITLGIPEIPKNPRMENIDLVPSHYMQEITKHVLWVELHPPKDSGILTPGTSECDLISRYVVDLLDS